MYVILSETVTRATDMAYTTYQNQIIGVGGVIITDGGLFPSTYSGCKGGRRREPMFLVPVKGRIVTQDNEQQRIYQALDSLY